MIIQLSAKIWNGAQPCGLAGAAACFGRRGGSARVVSLRFFSGLGFAAWAPRHRGSRHRCRHDLPHGYPENWHGLNRISSFFLFFGMILFFDKALMAIGNVLFVAGLAFVIGLERTFRFFFQKHKVNATGLFLGGVFVVLIGWPLIGMIFEIYGFSLLFRGFFPVVVGFIRKVPVLGSLLNLPGIRSFLDKVGESNNMV